MALEPRVVACAVRLGLGRIMMTTIRDTDRDLISGLPKMGRLAHADGSPAI